MKKSIKTGLSFGLTSGVITPLGLMMGLSTGTGLKIAVIGGILTVAVADSLSDAMGIHMSEESNKKNTHKQVWQSTFAAFFAKFFIALSFIPALIIFSLNLGIIINIVWGILLLIFFNYILAKQRGENPFIVIKNHILLILGVLLASHLVGVLIARIFG